MDLAVEEDEEEQPAEVDTATTLDLQMRCLVRRSLAERVSFS